MDEIAEVEEAAPPARVIYAYIAEGAFIPGIPARDLVDVDLVDVDIEALEASGLYEKKVSHLG